MEELNSTKKNHDPYKKFDFKEVENLLPSKLTFTMLNNGNLYVGKVISLFTIFKSYYKGLISKDGVLDYDFSPESWKDNTFLKVHGLFSNRMTYLSDCISSIKEIGDILFYRFYNVHVTYLESLFVTGVDSDKIITCDGKYKNMDSFMDSYDYWHRSLKDSCLTFERDLRVANNMLEKLLKKIKFDKKKKTERSIYGKTNEES